MTEYDKSFFLADRFLNRQSGKGVFFYDLLGACGFLRKPWVQGLHAQAQERADIVSKIAEPMRSVGPQGRNRP